MKIGPEIKVDAIGAWHRLEAEEAAATLRILRADRVDEPGARPVLLEEIRRIKDLDHPYLLRVLRHDMSSPRPWMITQSIEGETLADWVRRNGPLPEADARGLAEGLAAALAYLQKRRQVHVNAAPDRIVRVGSEWRLLTFRDVRAWDETSALKGKKIPVPRFAPPERERAAVAPFKALPLLAWTVGSLLRFALGGGPPRTAEGSPAPLPDGFPAWAAAPVERLTAADPDSRPQGLPAIERVLRGESVPDQGGSGSGRFPPAPTPRKRRR